MQKASPHASGAALLAVALALAIALPGTARAQSSTYTACYVPDAGAVYMIGQQDTPSTCLENSHVEFTFGGGDSAGVTDHGNLTGLGDDDHPQYLPTDGARLSKDGFAVSGSVGSGSIPASGAGTRMMWYPGKAALRTGEVDGAQWNDGNVGRHSVAFGLNTTASGDAASALGHETEAGGFAATSTGNGTTASGRRSLSAGYLTNATGDDAVAMGSNGTASGNASFVMGSVAPNATASNAVAIGMDVEASAPNAMALGAYGEANHEGTFVWSDLTDVSTQYFTSTGSHQFLVKARGGAGFGTNSPETQLDVQRQVSGSAADPGNHVAYVNNTATSGGDVLMLNSNVSQPGNAVNYITFGSAGGNIGAIEGNGSGGVTLTSGSGDFAELLPRARESESIEAGDVVGVFGGEITKRTAGAEQVMVVTDRAMILGSDPGPEARDGYEKVAFVGQVPVTVRGPVEEGDLLVASGREDGTARGVAPAEYEPVADGPTVGRAWSSSPGGTREVTALVGTAGRTAALRGALRKQRERIEAQAERLDRLEATVQMLVDRDETVEGGG